MVILNTLKESELVNSYLWEYHRTSLQWRRVRLGVVPTHELARMYMVTLRWADAIYVENREVYIVEAKLTPRADAVGQLLLYKELFRQTLEFKEFWPYPINMVFLCPRMDLNLAELCSKHDIKYVIYDPRKTVPLQVQ